MLVTFSMLRIRHQRLEILVNINRLQDPSQTLVSPTESLRIGYRSRVKLFLPFVKLRDKTNSNFSPSSGFEVFLYLLLFVNIECYEIEPGKLKLSRYNKSQRT